MPGKEIKLKVAEAIQDDVNKGIVRIDSSFMQQASIRPGDVVAITGDRTTVAIADRAYPGDIGLNIIRMDGIIRRNAKTGIGELIKIEKADVKEAKKIIIAPAKEGVTIKASNDIFKQGLLGRPIIKGDIVALGGTKRRRNSVADNPFFDEVFNLLDEGSFGFGFGDLKFLVADTNPKQPVIITVDTEVIFNPEAVEIGETGSAPEITYEDIGGLDEEIKKIREMVELPLKHPELFERLGIEPPKGVLLHGPPGTGKTLLAKAVANETNSHFIVINGPEIMSKYYGQSEENLRKKFEDAEKNAPSIIFIDEIDAIASKREETKGEVERRVVAQLLATMDGLKSRGKVVVIAATNVPNILDPALRRPGRFDREIEIGVPGMMGRLKILNIHTRNMPLLTRPESINKNYKTVDILMALGEIFEDLDIKKLLTSIDKNVKNKEEFKRISIDSFLKIILKSVKKEWDNNIKVFLKESLTKITEFIVSEVMNYIYLDLKIVEKDGTQKENKVIKLKEDALENLENRFKELKKEEGIKEVLSKIVKEIILEDIANITYGFVGADLQALSKEAAMVVLRRILPDLKSEDGGSIPPEILNKLYITREDFYEALKVVRPSALREVLIEIPNVRWEDVGGLEDVKQEIKEAVEWPLNHPDVFKRMGVNPPKGVLLYGSPGTGKTLLAKAVAKESKANFISVKGPELLSKWVGESEKAVREIFKKARQTSPTIIFFDEIDAIAPVRGLHQGGSHVTESVVNQLLTEMDGLEDMHDVVIMAASNRPDIIDPSLLRPGRFDRVILVPAPELEAREEIFRVHTKTMPLKDVDIKELAANSEGYTGADVESVCREAAILALRNSNLKAKEVTKKDFEAALEKVPPSATKDTEKAYEELKGLFSSAKAKQMKEERPNYMG